MSVPDKTEGGRIARVLEAEPVAGDGGLRLIFRCCYGFSKDGRFKRHIAECGDISVGPTFHSPLCKLARAIIKADPACAELPWQLVRDGEPALEGKRLANLAALDVREDGGTSFGKHKEPPTRTACHDRRKRQSKGHLENSGSPDTRKGRRRSTRDPPVRRRRWVGRRRTSLPRSRPARLAISA